MIEIKQLTKTYRGHVTALRGIDLNIGTGMFGLVGPNGAGKTTLMRILAGLINPSSGEVCVLDHNLNTPAGQHAVKAMLGYLPQELGLYPNLTAREFLNYVATLKGVTNRSTRREQINSALEKVRLADVADRQMKTYSGGMKRRVGIAQSILGQPKLLIVDEPTAGLDPEERVRLRNLLSDMAQDCTVILSTHIVEDISQSCNDLAVIAAGQVLFRGSPRDLIAQARNHVWNIITSGERPNSGLAIVSSLQMQDGIQYRVLGETADGYTAQSIEPSLEDGYMWLMHQNKTLPAS
jgi:ABC-type multidrug transport system ATPase subunit